MEGIKKKGKEYTVFVVYVACNLLFYGNFILTHYAADTYFTEALGWRITTHNYLAGGRWLMVAFLWLCEVFHIGFRLQQLMSWGIAIISISIAEMLVYKMFCKVYIEKEQLKNRLKRFWVAVCSFMLISNVFLLEDFVFAEYTGMMCLGILFDVLGAIYIIKCLSENKWNYYLLGIMFAILGINGHQGNFAIFVLICILGAKDTFNSVTLFIKNNIIIGGAYLLPALFNVWENKIGGSARAASHIDLKGAFLKTTEGIYNLMQSTSNFMPRWNMYIPFIVIFLAFFFWKAIRNKKWQAFVSIGYYFLIACLAIYAPFIMTEVKAIDVIPRTTYILGGIIPVILAVILFWIDIDWEKSLFVPIYIGIFLVVQYIGILRFVTSHYQANAVDRYEANMIADYLWRYEEETGNRVTKMALYWDENVTGLAPGVIGYGALNERAFCNEWVAPLALRCLNNVSLEQTPASEEVYEKYFQGKDWWQMEDEQMIIIGDTLHFCAY